jgi:hypothetical protein
MVRSSGRAGATIPIRILHDPVRSSEVEKDKGPQEPPDRAATPLDTIRAGIAAPPESVDSAGA